MISSESNAENVVEEIKFSDILIALPDQSTVKIRTSDLITVGDLIQIITDNSAARFYTCFKLVKDGVVLKESVPLKNVWANHETAYSLELLPDLYNEQTIKIQLTRFREVLTMFQSAATNKSLNYSISVLSGVSATSPSSEAEVKKTGFENPFENLGAKSSLENYFPDQSFNSLRTKMLDSFSYSRWGPVPRWRLMTGDLVYISITTLENDHFEIVGNVKGFYVSNSSDSFFDPTPKNPENIFHTIVDCISSVSSSFASSFKSACASIDAHDDMEYVLTTSGSNPWIIRNPKNDPDLGRMMDAIHRMARDNELLSNRDWNDEYQISHDLPASNIRERIVRDQNISRQHSDFITATVQGAVAIVDKTVLTLLPVSEEEVQIYLHNGIFFTTGYDDHGIYKNIGGKKACHVAYSKDIDGIRILSSFEGSDMKTVQSAVVDYMGRRVMAQAIIPGLLRKREKTEQFFKYGSNELEDGSGVEVVCDADFHESVGKIAKAMQLEAHTVVDDKGNKVELYTSLDVKGVVGDDGRKYLIDLYGLTPIDINFLERCDKESKDDEAKKYPHRLCVLRPEMVQVYTEFELKQHISKHRDAMKDQNTSEEPSEEEIMKSCPELDLSFNVDAFKACNVNNETRGCKTVRDMGVFLAEKLLPSTVIQLIHYPKDIPVDGEQLTTFLHNRGINMRYLGAIASLIDSYRVLPQFKDLVVEEMIVRTLKTILRDNIRELPKYIACYGVAHVLNCFFAQSNDAVPVSEIDPVFMKNSMSLDFQELTQSSVRSTIVTEVYSRFRYDISDLIDSVIKTRRVPILRSLCLKVGIQILAREYNLEHPDFKSSDILNFVPLVKSAHPISTFAEASLQYGQTALYQGKKDTAIELFGESIGVLEQCHGPVSPETARAYSSLASVYIQLGDVDNATKYQKKAVFAYERTLGMDHPDTLHQYVVYGYIVYSAGDIEKALKLFNHALKYLEILTCGHPNSEVAGLYIHLSKVFMALKDHDHALSFAQKAYEMNSAFYGDENHTIINCLEVLVGVHAARKELKEAVVSQKRIHSFCEEKYGIESPMTKEAWKILNQLTQQAVVQAKQERQKPEVV